MKKNGAAVFLAAGVVCMVSVTALIAGMNVYATQQGNQREILDLPQDTGSTEENDVITEALDVTGDQKVYGQKDMEFPDVPVVTWEESYQLANPSYVIDKNAGTELEPVEGQLTREEAARIGMIEVNRIFGENMDGMKAVIMLLQKAEGNQSADLWSGYVCNFLNGVNPDDGKMRSYSFEMNAVTGEIFGVKRRISTAVDQLDEVNRLTDQELVAKAEELALKFQFVDPNDEFQKNAAVENHRTAGEGDGDLLYLTSDRRNVVFRKGERTLRLMFGELDGAFWGYQYDDNPL